MTLGELLETPGLQFPLLQNGYSSRTYLIGLLAEFSELVRVLST